MPVGEQEMDCLPPQEQVGDQIDAGRSDSRDKKHQTAQVRCRDGSFDQEDPESNDTKDANLEPKIRLTDKQKKLLQEQHDVPDGKIPFSDLLQFTTGKDRLLVAASVFWAIASGIAFPAMSIPFGHLSATIAKSQYSVQDDLSGQLSTFALYFVYLAIGTFVAVALSMFGFMHIGEKVSDRVREEYLTAILRQNVGFFDNLGAGEVTTRITSDMNKVQDGISEKVAFFITALSTFISAFVIGFIVSWKLTLILSCTIVIMTAIMALPTFFVVKYSTLGIESSGKGNSIAEEVLSSIRNAVAFNSQEKLARKYDQSMIEAEKWGFRMRVSVALMLSGIMCFVFLDYGFSFWISARLLVRNEVTLQNIQITIMTMFFAAFTLGTIGPYIQAISTGLAAAQKVLNTIKRVPPLDPSSTTGKELEDIKGSILLKNITHVYPSRPDRMVLKDISISFPARKVTAIVGASGSGKSSIINLLERYYDAVDGQVFLDGHDTRDLNLKWLRQQMSLVSQDPILFNTSIYNNIAYGLTGSRYENASEEKKKEIITNAAVMANAHDFIQGLAEGYDTVVGERGTLLSGGQKQRISIARAIARDPPVLLLDEATSALDSKSEALVQAALEVAARGRTTIVIAHRLSTIKTADNILVMSHGRIEEQGTHKELFAYKGAYFRLATAQQLSQEAISQDMVDLDEFKDISENAPHVVPSQRLDKSEEDLSDNSQSKSGKQLESVQEAVEHQYSIWTLFKFVASLNGPELPFMLIGLFFSIIGGGENPTHAVFFAKAVNVLAVNPDAHETVQKIVNFWCEMYLMLGLVVFLSFAIFGVCFAYCAERLIHRARNQAFRAMLRQDISFFDEPLNTAGALISILSTETTHLAGMSGVSLGTILVATTTLTAIIVLSTAVAWKMALAVISTLPVLLACGFFRFRLLSKLETRAAKDYAKSAAYASEAASAIRVVASLTREDSIVSHYRNDLALQRRQNQLPALMSACLYAASQSVDLFCTALAFWWGGSLHIRGDIDNVQFFIAFSCLIFGGQAAGTVFANAPDMSKCRQASQTIKTLLDRKPKIDTWSKEGEQIETTDGSIEIRDVQFSYPTSPDQLILKGLNLSIKAGQYIALVGPSGCGKSTIIALLERFYDPVAGSILFDGKDISSLNINDYRNHLALVSQESTLYNGTIRENILLGCQEDSDSLEEPLIAACKDANIYEFIMSLPEGFSTNVGSKGVLLSGGQKQRIAIARALIRQPTVLLLDEATSALDSKSEKVVQAALDAASYGRTTIAVAHRLSTVQRADVVYVFDKGRIVEQGTHVELLRQKGAYFDMVQMQSLEST